MKIGIIGAGLSGLTCGWYLKKNSINDITIFESSEKAGGKLKTDRIDGFQLDRGFQVLLQPKKWSPEPTLKSGAKPKSLTSRMF